ncbi:UMP kinase [Candidatus Micrarchaeota archaeon]|nr:UMP kinase [Candidatus Micrarchaeota archaeon]
MAPLTPDLAPLVISLGGSLLNQPGYAGSFAALLKPFLSKRKFAVVTGGGKVAAQYAEAARKRMASSIGAEFYADFDAIEATRENAADLKKTFGSLAYSKIILHPLDAVAALKKKNIVLSGGFLPGITTDACSVLVAEAIGAPRVVNASRIDGIYDKNPSEFPDARRFDRLTHDELVQMASKFDQRKARTNFVFDVVAAKLAARSKIQIDFVDGRDLTQLKAAIEGKAFDGTRVR